MGAQDLSAVKKAAAARSKGAKKMSTSTKYAMWIGGTVVLIVAACVVLIVNPDRGPFEIPVNDHNLITHVNRNSKTWGAGSASSFEDWTIGDVKTLDGISVSQMGGGVPNCQVPEVEIPAAFDAREKWPQCFNNPIYTMNNCTASWAITAASSLSNRFCISDPEQYSELILSPQQLISCDKQSRGCEGGDIDSVWNYIEHEGLVSEICFPYQADGTVACSSKTKCSNETPLKGSSHCVLNNEAAIKREVMTNGPVVAPVFLMDDFLVYKSGVYKEMPTATQLSDARRQRILHAVKILGWGTYDGSKQYWIVENSFGKDWGDEGFGKIHMGGAEGSREGIVVDSFVVAGTPLNKKVGDSQDGGDDDDFELEDVDLDSEADADLEE